MAKMTGRSNTSSKNEKKKKKGKGSSRLLSGPGAAAMKASKPVSVLNPFESIWSRRKFDVVGKRRKGEERRIGLARSLAIEKVLATSLQPVYSFDPYTVIGICFAVLLLLKEFRYSNGISCELKKEEAIGNCLPPCPSQPSLFKI